MDHSSFILGQHHGVDTALRDGNTYSGSPPAASFLAIPYYLLFKPLISLFPKKDELLILNLLLFLLAGGPVTALTTVLVFRFLGHFPSSEKHRLCIAIAFAFGTMTFGYAADYYKKTLAMLALFLAIYLLFLNRREAASSDTKRPLLSGLICGVAFGLDYPSALFTGLLFFYLLATSARRHAMWFILGDIPPIALPMRYHHLAFEHLLYTSYTFKALSVSGEFCTFSALISMRSWFGPLRGLFVFSPVILLSAAGLVICWKDHSDYRPELGLIAALFLANSLIIACPLLPWAAD